MIPAYDLREFILDGGDRIERIWARPSAWDGVDVTGTGEDAEGNQVNPTEYQATCPECGQLMVLKAGETMVLLEDVAYAACPECGFGREHLNEILGDLQTMDEAFQFHFVNPIEMGLMKDEEKWLVTS